MKGTGTNGLHTSARTLPGPPCKSPSEVADERRRQASTTSCHICCSAPLASPRRGWGWGGGCRPGVATNCFPRSVCQTRTVGDRQPCTKSRVGPEKRAPEQAPPNGGGGGCSFAPNGNTVGGKISLKISAWCCSCSSTSCPLAGSHKRANKKGLFCSFKTIYKVEGGAEKVLHAKSKTVNPVLVTVAC